jgi:hypothetical protein
MVIENNRNASNEVHNFHGYYSINYFDSRTRYTIVSSCKIVWEQHLLTGV